MSVPVRVHGLSVSEAVSPLLGGGRASLHSVFTRAVNVDVGDRLMTIADTGAGRLPNGISVGDVPDFRAFGLLPDDAVVLHGSWLVMPRAGLLIDLAAAVRWDPRLAQTTRPIGARGSGRLAALAPTGGLGSPATDPWQAWPAIRALREGLADHDLARALRAARDLAGRGPGLTPSGDDLLVGCSAALTATGHAEARSFARGAADAARGRTTAVAQTYHEHAADGAYGEHLHEVLTALTADDETDLRVAVGRALAWGATSGADALLGVVIGLEASA